jgi:hypothetical protein
MLFTMSGAATGPIVCGFDTGASKFRASGSGERDPLTKGLPPTLIQEETLAGPSPVAIMSIQPTSTGFWSLTGASEVSKLSP